MRNARRRRLQGLFAAVLLAGAGAGAQQVPRIGAAELKGLLERGEAVVIDVRDGVSFVGGHIAGARSVPLADLDRRLSELPKDKHIVAYCT